jgi:penicillin amidase
MQLDLLDLQATAWLDRLLVGVEPATDDARRCLDLLGKWDRIADQDSVGAAVWALFFEEFVRHALEDDLGAEATRVALSVTGPSREPLGNGLFFDAFVEDLPASSAYALDRACARLRAGLGEDPAAWTWGAIHPLTLKHPFAARAPKLLKAWNMRPVPFEGTGSTLGVASNRWGRDTLEAPVTTMASLRMVMPLDDLAASTLVYPGGQSGHPRSVGYATHYNHFVAGKGLPLWFADADVEANAVARLQIVRSGDQAAADSQ